MKKSIIVIPVAMLLLAGCSAKPSSDLTSRTTATPLTPTTAVASTKATEVNVTTTITNTTTSTTIISTPAPLQELPLGETITVDGIAELTFELPKFQNVPTANDYTFQPNKNSNTDICLTICLKYKNLNTFPVEGWGRNSTRGLTFGDLIYKGEYHYPSTWTAVDTISPLSTGTIIAYWVLPQEVETDDGSLTVNICIADTNYQLTVR